MGKNETSSKGELRDLLVSRSLIVGPVVLSNGQASNFYFDCKRTTLHSRGASLLADAFLEEIDTLVTWPDAVGGITHGADPIVGAVMMRACERGRPIDSFYVRKEPKAHGTKQWIENPPPEGSRVVIVEDVVTSGASVIKAIEQAQAAKCEVVAVVSLVDRLQGGGDNIRGRCAQYTAIFDKHDFPELVALEGSEPESPERGAAGGPR